MYDCADKSCYITVPRSYAIKERILLSHDEEIILFKRLKSVPTETNCTILLALTTGMRIGEICALKWSDIDLKKRIIAVNRTVQRIRTFASEQKTKIIESLPKSVKSKREIPIPDVVYEHIKALSKGVENDDYFLSSSKKIIEPRTLQYRFKSILKKEKLPSVTFHSLRHLFATKCIELGVDVKTLSELLGHSSVEITLNRYVHSSIERKVECIRLYSDSYCDG